MATLQSAQLSSFLFCISQKEGSPILPLFPEIFPHIAQLFLGVGSSLLQGFLA